MKESDIQRKIIKWLESEGHYVVKVVSATKSGVPDILTCVDGKFVGIEVKKPTTRGQVSPLQTYNLEKIEEAGGYSLVAWDLEMVQDFIREEVI